MKFSYFVIIFLLVFSACETETTNSGNGDQNSDDQTEIKSPKQDNKWLCVPNKQVGLINADANEENVVEAYGKENVVRKEVGIGEGETILATIVFPDSPNELIIEWQQDFEFKRLDRIRIERENAQWETKEGIKIGTTLDELIAANGKDFNFYGFDWDYGGTTNEWEGGNINPQLTVFLNSKNPEGTPQELAGDGLFSSSNPKAKEAQLEVEAFVIYFGL